MLGLGWTWFGEPASIWVASVHPERGEVFNWLDVVAISIFMLLWAGGAAVVLALATLASAYLAGAAGADGTLYARFLELGYQFAPVCLVSLVIGLGGQLFAPLGALDPGAPDIAKQLLFALGLAWSVYIGWRLLGVQGLPPDKRLLPLFPGVAGSAAAGIAWWVGIFGPIEIALATV
jgi:hypothetical protein